MSQTYEKVLAARDAKKREMEDAEDQARLMDEHAETLRREVERLNNAVRVMEQYGEVDGEVAEPGAPKPTNKDAVLMALRANPGRRVGDLVEWIARTHKIDMKNKTAGNNLWELKRDGLAHREGQKWFPAQKEPPKDGSNGGSFDNLFRTGSPDPRKPRGEARGGGT